MNHASVAMGSSTAISAPDPPHARRPPSTDIAMPVT